MADPARASAADPGPGNAEPARPDPLSPGWANVHVQNMLAAVTEATGVAVAELAARPRCAGALRRVDALHAVLAELAGIIRGCVLDESVAAARERAAYERGVADCRAARCHLEAVPTPH